MLPSLVRTAALLVVVSAPWTAAEAQAAGTDAVGWVRPAPAGIVAAGHSRRALPRVERTFAVRVPSVSADSLAARRRAFHIGALTGAVLLGTAAFLVAEPWAEEGGGDDESGRLGARFVLIGVGTGAVLGGVAGALVYEVREAVRAR